MLVSPTKTRHSSPFVASVALVAFALIIALGVSAVGPDKKDPNADGSGTANLTPLSAPTVTFINPRAGAEKPKLHLVVFGDYGCAACKTLDTALVEVLKKYPNDIAVVWKDLPNPQAHPGSGDAAVAARCAAVQGAFWQYHDALYAQSSVFSVDTFMGLASAMKLDTAAFSTCITNTETLPLIERDIEEAVRLGIDATPYLFIGERRVSGAIDAATLEAFVKEAL